MMDPSLVQPGILAPVPRLARYLFFTLSPDTPESVALNGLKALSIDENTVVGVGASLVRLTDKRIDTLRDFPAESGRGIDIPSTPYSLWCWLRGDDRGALVHRTREVQHALGGAFVLDHVVDAFQYGASRDLTGYEDGTENPKGDAAIAAAIARGPGLEGSSFVAVQQWVHDLDRFAAMRPEEQDHTFGRRKSDNTELADAPPSAHVKRTAQESFDPVAFVLRRSMPWADAMRAGLVFVAFGLDFDAFEAQLRRMRGAEDGIVDALFRFTRPITGSYFWCPPVTRGRLDLSALL